MQKLGLSQNLQQKLSPQQIQFIKLLQVPTAELENRVEEELEINPALEEGATEDQEDTTPEADTTSETEQEETPEKEEVEIDLKDYLGDDEYSGYKTQNDNGRMRMSGKCQFLWAHRFRRR
jgi:RNA polymerase sigma-54 factor